MESIAHYPDLTNYTEKEISENIIKCIQLAKEKRLRIGGHNQHPVWSNSRCHQQNKT